MVIAWDYLRKVQDQPGVADPHSPLEVLAKSRSAVFIGQYFFLPLPGLPIPVLA